MSAEGKMYFGGIPTGPDVRLLNDKYPDIKQGDEITYNEICEIVNVPDFRSSRFRSVLSAWRNDLQKNKGLITTCVKGHALRIMEDNEVVGQCYDVVKSNVKRTKKQIRKVSTIRPKDEITRNQADHARLRLFNVLEATQEAEKQLSISPPVTVSPRIQPPEESMEKNL